MPELSRKCLTTAFVCCPVQLWDGQINKQRVSPTPLHVFVRGLLLLVAEAVLCLPDRRPVQTATTGHSLALPLTAVEPIKASRQDLDYYSLSEIQLKTRLGGFVLSGCSLSHRCDIIILSSASSFSSSGPTSSSSLLQL